MNDGQIINDLEKISDFGIKLLNSARKNITDLKKKASDENQHYFHGLAWYATYIKAIENTTLWIKDLKKNNELTDYELEIAKVGLGEFCLQVLHGIPMSQSETIRPSEIKIDEELLTEFSNISKNIIENSSSECKQNLCKMISKNTNNGIFPKIGLDETYEQI